MKQKITFVLNLLFGLMFINGGLNKFFNYMPAPKEISANMMKAMTAMMELTWLIPLIATAEIIGGVLIIFPKTRALGALIIFPVMVGILLTHLIQDTSNLPIALILAAILAWIIYDNREKYLPLIQS